MVSRHNENESAEEMLARMTDPPAMEDVISYLDQFIRRLHKKFVELKAAGKFEVYEAYRVGAQRGQPPCWNRAAAAPGGRTGLYPRLARSWPTPP